MNIKEILKILSETEPKSMQFDSDVVWKKAKNDTVWDQNNKKYIDFTSTIFVQNIGHSNKRVVKYIKKQLNKNLLHSYIYPHEIRAKYLKKLKTFIGDNRKAFLLSSGTEATEAAIKLMKRYDENKNIILSIKGAMHGRTMAASIIKNEGIYKNEDFVLLPYPNEKHNIEDYVDMSKVGGIILETYQGWSAKHLPNVFIHQLKQLKEKYGFLVCFDSIQAGIYRNGYLFGWEKYNIIPDLFCLGKGLGGGLPLSAVIGNKEILDIPNVGDMSSTHSANPIVCAAGLAVLEELEKRNFKKIFKLFEVLIHEMKSNKLVIDVNYSGMVCGIIFKSKEIADEIYKECLSKGLLTVHTGKESIKFGPPLTIKPKNLIKGFKIFKKVLENVKN